MTITQAIAKIDELKPNTYSYAEKVRWLSLLDGMVDTEILATHEGGGTERFCGYGADTPQDTELLVPFPYDEVYIKWLEAQMDYAAAETNRYYNSRAAASAAYMDFAAYYNRTHMPKSPRPVKLF